MGISRRGFMQATAGAAAAAVAFHTSIVRGAEVAVERLIDTNVVLGEWPFRHVQPGNTPALVGKLREQGVTQAWVSSLDALLHKDISSVNARLAEECKQHGKEFLIPFGAINLKLPDWEEDLRRCHEVHRMPGIRLHPNYHGYALDHPEFARLLKAAAEAKLIVQIAVLMEDERMMHPLMRVPPVKLSPLAKVLQQTPGARVVLLNALKGARDARLAGVINAGEVYCEIAMLEGVGGVGQLLAELPADRVLFGSHAPSLYFESSLLKLRESGLPAPHLRAISRENARRLLAE
jgi:predicted TIM-barrel fold metal-dependent hydrolase